MNEQRCDLCEKEYTCPKSAHVENYSLTGCYQFVPRTGERLSIVGADSDKQPDPTDDELAEAAEDAYNNIIHSLIEVTADRNDLVRKLRDAYKMILDLLKEAETGETYTRVSGSLNKLNEEYSDIK